MKKPMIVLLIILISGILSSCSYPSPSKETAIPTPSDGSFSDKAEVSIEKIQEVYPDFVADPDESYIAVNKNEDIWFSFNFTELDKGLGAEVVCENGNYTVTFNHDTYENRLKLIAKMNELMPDNAMINRRVEWNPFPNEVAYKYYSGAPVDYFISYVVVSKDVDVDKQLAIDYEVFKYVYDLSKELGVNVNGIRVAYYYGDPNVDIGKDNNIFTTLDRDFGVSSFGVYVALGSDEYTEKCEYWVISSDYEYTNLPTVDLEEIMASKDSYADYVKTIMK